MTRSSFAEIDCPIAQAADQLADKWKFVILRNAFNGMTRYDDFAQHLGVASNVLAGRLAELVDAGILEKRTVVGDGRAVDYKLTLKGHDLFPMLVFLSQWSDRWMKKSGGQRIVISSTTTGENAEPVQVRTPSGEVMTSKTSRIKEGKGKSAALLQLHELVAKRKLASIS